MMRPGWRSKPGWALAAAYLVAAALLYREANACGFMLCFLVVLPALFPFGLLCAWLIDWLDSIYLFPGYSANALILRWYFALPAVLANACFYHWLGRQAEKLFRMLFMPGNGQRAAPRPPDASR